MPPREIHFFDKRHNFQKGPSWYRQFFANASEEKAIGEKTPDYYWTKREGAENHLPNAHQNIHELLPEAKLILVVRNPVKRAISAVNHLLRTRRVSPRYSIDQLLLGDKQHLIREHGVIDYGRYYRHIQTYLELFEREQLLVLVFEEDVVSSPRQGLQKAAEFLNVDPSFPFSDLHRRQNPAGVSKGGLYLRYYLPFLTPIVKAVDKYVLNRNYKQHPTRDTVRALYELYESDNENLFQFLGRTLPSWVPPNDQSDRDHPPS